MGDEVVGNVRGVVGAVDSFEGTAFAGWTEHLLVENVMSSIAISPW